MDILGECKTFLDEMIEIRRHLHTIPEVGNQEFQTTDFIINYLQSLGYSIERPLETGCVATLCGRGDKTVAFRSDIDALPIRETTCLSFASKNGNMHACGHDMHMASLLGAAKILSRHASELKGNIKLVFQPDEEQDGGAKRLLESGVLKGVDAIFGCHINPGLKAGVIGVHPGKFYASAGKFDIVVKGKSSHGAEPENGIDAIQAGALLATRFQRLNGTYHGYRCVVSVGKMHGGSVRNIICDNVEMAGIIRSLSKDVLNDVMGKMKEIIAEVEKQTGCTVESNIYPAYPGVDNDADMYAFVKDTAIELFGKEAVQEVDATMTSEDFGEYLKAIPGCFYHVGVESEFPLHHGNMNPQEDALLQMSMMCVSLLTKSFDYLDENH